MNPGRWLGPYCLNPIQPLYVVMIYSPHSIKSLKFWTTIHYIFFNYRSKTVFWLPTETPDTSVLPSKHKEPNQETEQEKKKKNYF